MVTADVATYNRVSSPGEATLVERFIDAAAGDASGTPLTAGATVASASDLEITDDDLDAGPWEGLGISAEDVGVTVPAGAGAQADEIKPQNVMAMAPGGSIYDPQWSPESEWASGTNWFPGPRWIPDPRWIPGGPGEIGDVQPGDEWIPGGPGEIGDERRTLQVYLTSGEEPRPELFGGDSSSGTSLEEGEEIPLDNTVLAAPLDVFVPGPRWSPEEVHGAGRPAPLGGRTFGLSVASFRGSKWVLNQDLFAGRGREFTNDMLYSAMGTDAETVEWRTDPSQASDSTNSGPDSASLLGTDVEIQSFTGALDGPTATIGVGIHVARVETQDGAVIAVGTHNWPVGQSPGPEVGGLLSRARGFFTAAVERLDFEDQVAATTPTPAPTPGPDGDRLSGTQQFPPNRLSTSDGFTAEEQSQFSISFENLTACSMDVFVVPSQEFQAFVNGGGGSGRPDEIREGFRSLAQTHAPEELRFFGANSGSGATQLSPGTYQMVFVRSCELGERTAIDFTAEIESGDF